MKSKRYAEALSELALESGDSSLNWVEKLNSLAELLSDKQFATFLTDAGVPLESKRKFMGQLVSKLDLPDDLRRFAYLLNDKSDILLAQDIAKQFNQIAQKEASVVSAEVTTSSKLSLDQLKEIEDLVKHMFSKTSKVVINSRLDKNLIGGVKIQVGDTLFDSTLKSKLGFLKNSLVGMPVS